MLGSSARTWSKQEMGARKMMAFMSSKKGTQAAVKIGTHQKSNGGPLQNQRDPYLATGKIRSIKSRRSKQVSHQ